MSNFSFTHYHLPRLREYPKLLWSQALGSLGTFLVTTFIPIFFLKEVGLDLRGVILWYLLFASTAIIWLYIGSHIVSRFGGNKAIALGLLMQAVGYSIVLQISEPGFLIWLSAIALAGFRGIYWMGFHAIFSKIKGHNNPGNRIGATMALTHLTHGLSPAIGGLIAHYYGISVLSGVGVGLLLVAAIPMLYGREITTRRPLNLRLLDLRMIKNDLVANGGNSLTELTVALIWPIWIYLIVGTYSAVGVLSSVALITTIIVTLYVAHTEREYGEKHYLRNGIAVLELSHLLRFIAMTPTGVFVVNSVFGISQALKSTPYITRYYRLADREPRVEYIFAFEVAFQTGLILGSLVLLAGTYFLSSTYVLLLGIAFIIPFCLLTLKIR